VADRDRDVPGSAARLIGERIRRRVQREPVAYILGRKGFRHIELAVDPRVLIPRPETELLVEVALELPAGARAHEVGTGSGAVALALLDERPDLDVSASDASPAAVEVARANAAHLGLELDVNLARGLPEWSAQLRSSTDQSEEGKCDLVLANLPYVREDEWPALEPEIVKFEPREALVAGADGLDGPPPSGAASRSAAWRCSPPTRSTASPPTLTRARGWSGSTGSRAGRRTARRR
jgi:release factor glutamine methyltransferase